VLTYLFTYLIIHVSRKKSAKQGTIVDVEVFRSFLEDKVTNETVRDNWFMKSDTLYQTT